jgi:hypothetical protein
VDCFELVANGAPITKSSNPSLLTSPLAIECPK